MPETFYDRVYAFVRTIPSGSVVTYGQVALELDASAAARAVGYALNALNTSAAPSDIPWWRVINARGEISLKNRGAAADHQRALLESEGVIFNAEGQTDLQRFRWWPQGHP